MTEIVLEKRLSANDLGRTGGHQAGILVPKAAVGMFPQLDLSKPNPRMTLQLHDRYGHEYSGEYIYYNSKITEERQNGRDEYRITRIGPLLNRASASTGNVIRLRKVDDDTFEVSVHPDFTSDPGQRVVESDVHGRWRILVARPVDGKGTGFTSSDGQESRRPTGRGYRLSAQERTAVEKRAMDVVTNYYERSGWTVYDRSSTEAYDLECVKGGVTLHVEVKGTVGAGQDVELTSGEVRHANRKYPHTALAVVSEINLTKSYAGVPSANSGQLRIFTRWKPEPVALTPINYRYRVPRS